MRIGDYILIFLVSIVIGFYIALLAHRDAQLMDLCADHTTRTLYECK